MSTKENYEWVNLVEGKEVDTGNNSQVRTSVIERSDGKVTGVLTIRKWAKYVKKEEKEMGISLSQTDFRPTRDGLSLPVDCIDELIETLQELKKWAEENNIK